MFLDPTNLQTSGIQQQQLHLHAIQNPCVATMSMCPLRCNSFAKGPTGCELCMCANTQQVTASATTTGNAFKLWISGDTFGFGFSFYKTLFYLKLWRSGLTQ